MMHRFLIFLFYALVPFLAAAVDADNAAAARLARLGKAVENYRAVYGQPPDSLRQLYARGFLRNFDDVRLPGSSSRFPTLDKLDAEADFILARNPADGVLLTTREGTPGPQLAYHSGGQITTRQGSAAAPAEPARQPPATVARRPADPSPGDVDEVTIVDEDGHTVIIEGQVDDTIVTELGAQIVIRDPEGTITVRPSEEAHEVVLPPVPPAAPPVNAAHNQGLALLRAGNYQQAELLLRQAATDAPAVAQYRNDHATALYHLGHYALAEQGYRAAIKLDPAPAWFHDNLSMTLRMLQRYPDAIAASDQAIRRAPAQASYHFNRGLAEEAVRQYPAAQRSYTQAARLGPAVAEHHYALARVLAWQAKSQEALPAVDQALRLTPGRADMHAFRGNVLFNLGKYPAAIPAYREAIRLLPTFAQAYADLAGTYYVLGDHQAARAWATAAIQRGCPNHWVYNQLGMR